MFTIHTVIVRFLDLPFVDADTKTQGDRTIVVGLRRFEVDIVRGPCGVRIESLYVLILTYRTYDRKVVVGSPQTLCGNCTESLGILTDAFVTFGLRLAGDDRTMPFFALSCGHRLVGYICPNTIFGLRFSLRYF